jgi:type 1 glutamine amidotransferase
MIATRILAIAAACTCFGQVDPTPFFKANTIRVLILSGRNNHDWRSTTPFLRRMLTETGRFDVRVVEEPAGITAATLKPYDVVVSDYNGPRLGSETEAAIEAFVAGGKGIVIVHGASYAFGTSELLADGHKKTGLFEPPWPRYAEMVGAAWTQQPRTGHGKRHKFTVKFIDREHAISKGLGEGFSIDDELYHQFQMRPDVHVVATAYDSPDIGGTGKDEPLLWTLLFGKGRSFHTALGHDLRAMEAPGFVATFVRGVEWAATGGVAGESPKR